MSLKPPGGRGDGAASTLAPPGANKQQPPQSSFLKLENSTLRSGMQGGGGGGANKTSNFSKMLSGRGAVGGQSMRRGRHGHDDGKSSGSGRRSRKKKKDDSARVIVDGKDVTPLPLMAHQQAAAMGFATMAAGIGGIGAPAHAGGVGQSMIDMSAFESVSEHGGFGGMMGHSLAHGGASTISGATGGDEHSFFGGERHYEGGSIGGFARPLGMQFEYALDPTGAATGAQLAARELTDRELREKHTIKIEETDTMTLFHLPGLKIWSEDETEAAKALAANKNYEACLEKHKEKDKYTARLVQTFNPSLREKEVQVAPPATKSVSVEVTTWDIYDINTRLEQQLARTGASLAVPKIQHESELLSRASQVSVSGGGATTRAEEDEEDLAVARVTGGGVGGLDGAGGRGGQGATGTSNTPSVHSAQQSFHGGAANQSFRGGKGNPADRSWHQNLTLASGAIGGQSGLTLSSHANQSTIDFPTGGGGATNPKASTMGGGAAGNVGGAGGHLAQQTLSHAQARQLAVTRMLARPSILRRLKALEQAVVQNGLHQAQLLYRNHPEGDEHAWREEKHAWDAAVAAEQAAAAAAAQAANAAGALTPAAGTGAGASALSATGVLASGSATAPTGLKYEFQQATMPTTKADDANGAADAQALASSHAGAGGAAAATSARLIPLWSFQCALTAGMNVSCLTWNKLNPDLLAAGYGSVEFGHGSRDANGHSIQGIRVPSLPNAHTGASTARLVANSHGAGGLILFWSLANPSYPAKIILTKYAVTSLDFSDEHPHLLAAGLYDGTVAIYDIRGEVGSPGASVVHASKPALESVHSSGKHSEPVWGVKFVAKESPATASALTAVNGGQASQAQLASLLPSSSKRAHEQLVSISTDGSVKTWSMKKGLVPHELMQLKRISNRASLLGAQQASTNPSSAASMEGLSREASGLCFDFPINDGTQYFAGTEDGLIHKCSVSYNEQTLENFYGHTGPVYKVRCSPFLSEAFLSCSADWTAMLWSQKQSARPLLKFNSTSGHDYIMDIVWSLNQACMFGLVSRDGRIEIWDLSVSPLDPVIKYHINEEATATNAANGGAATGANTVSGSTFGTSIAEAEQNGLALPASTPAAAAAPPRFLSCLSFSSNAPVVLVGTTDGAIEVFRVEGTALTSTPPPAAISPATLAASSANGETTPNGTLVASASTSNALAAAVDANAGCYGQELNAATVLQVPRDRERESTGAGAADPSMHEEASRAALEAHALALLKFKAEARKLESIMEQHNESKNKLVAGGPSQGANDAAQSK